MKKLTLSKIFVIVFFLIMGFYLNAFFGNPVSMMLSRNAVEKYIAHNYANTDYYIDDMTHSLYSQGYIATVKSEKSVDTVFTLITDMHNDVIENTYDERVSSGYNTAMRLSDEYDELVDSVFDEEAFPYPQNNVSARIKFANYESAVSGYENSLHYKDLQLDKVYDLTEFAEKSGYIRADIYDDEATPQRAAEVLREIKAYMDNAGVKFRFITFELMHQYDDGRDTEYVRVDNFPYEQIDSDDLADKINARQGNH